MTIANTVIRERESQAEWQEQQERRRPSIIIVLLKADARYQTHADWLPSAHALY